MGSIRTIALVILGISGFTFVALFGKLPALRYEEKGMGNWLGLTHAAGELPLACSTESFAYIFRMGLPVWIPIY